MRIPIQLDRIRRDSAGYNGPTITRPESNAVVISTVFHFVDYQAINIVERIIRSSFLRGALFIWGLPVRTRSCSLLATYNLGHTIPRRPNDRVTWTWVLTERTS